MSDTTDTRDQMTDARQGQGLMPKPRRGYDTVAGEVRDAAIDGTVKSIDLRQEKSWGNGATSVVSITVCEGIVETSSALEIKQSLAADYLGTLQIDQKMAFLKRQKATARSVSIVVYAHKMTDVLEVERPRIDVDISAMTPDRFVDNHGDSFINSVVYGGEYYGVYTFYTETKEEQTKISTELKTTLAKGKSKVELGAQTDINNFMSTTTTSWKFEQQATGLTKPNLRDREEIVAYALDFPNKTFDQPSVVEFSTTNYKPEHGFTLDFEQVYRNRDYFVGHGIVDGGLAADLLKVVALQNKVTWLDEIYQFYGYDGDADLEDFDVALSADLAAIGGQFAAYRRDATQRFVKPPLPSLAKGTPMLSYIKVNGPRMGGTGGAPFAYGNVEAALGNHRRLTWLQLRGGKHVDQITLQYTDAHGTGPKESFGRSGGAAQIPLSFDTRETISAITAFYGDVLNQISIYTNKNTVTSAGRENGDGAVWNAGKGEIALGIEGRCGKYVDMLRLVVIRFQPATFSKKG